MASAFAQSSFQSVCISGLSFSWAKPSRCSGLKALRMPTARSIASRATAMTSGSMSAISSFSSTWRLLNSSVFAPSSASERGRTFGSHSSTAAARERYFLMTRSLREPKTFDIDLESAWMTMGCFLVLPSTEGVPGSA